VAFFEITNVSKGFGGPLVLSAVNRSTERGEFVAIVGYSGSGKRTLISMIAGLQQPDGGDDQAKRSRNHRARARSRSRFPEVQFAALAHRFREHRARSA
jgi:ABC-type Fe3+/spermidine/putrescine transport system ATPase subunit